MGETSKKRQEGKQPKAHKHKKYGYQLFKDKMVSKVKAQVDNHGKILASSYQDLAMIYP